MSHKMAGKGDKMKGKVKETAGKITGDKSTEYGGKGDRLKGKVKEGTEKVREKITGD